MEKGSYGIRNIVPIIMAKKTLSSKKFNLPKKNFLL